MNAGCYQLGTLCAVPYYHMHPAMYTIRQTTGAAIKNDTLGNCRLYKYAQSGNKK